MVWPIRIGVAAAAVALVAYLGVSMQPHERVPAGADASRADAIALANRAIDAFVAAPSFHVRGEMAPVRGAEPFWSPLPSGADDPEEISFAGDVSAADKLLDLVFDVRVLGAGRLRLASDGRAYVQLDDHLPGEWQEWATGVPTTPGQTTFPTYVFDADFLADVLRPALDLPNLLIAQRDPVPCPEAASVGIDATCDIVDLALIDANIPGVSADADPAPTGRPVSSWETRIRMYIDQATSLPDTIEFRGPIPSLPADTQAATLRLRDYGVTVDAPPPSPVASQPFDPDSLLAD